MIMTIEEEDLKAMIESTFSIILSIWESLQPPTQQRAILMVKHMCEKHPLLLKEKINILPSLESIPQMPKLAATPRSSNADLDIREQFRSFSQRCQHENVIVVSQGLKELLPFLRQNQSSLHQMAVSEQVDPIVSDLMRSLLDACVRFASKGRGIADLCAQCIGLLGCLDPNRVEAARDEQEILLVNNFEEREEAVSFVMLFLQVVVKAFMSATNSRSHGFLGFAMQELLRFCELDTAVTSRGSDTQRNASYRRWIALPEVVRNCLTPFLTSNYMMRRDIPEVGCDYPIFSTRPSHQIWLQTFVADLLHKGSGDNAKEVFSVCSRIIKQDASIANFLIPFVALNVVTGEAEHQASPEQQSAEARKKEQQAHQIGLELLGVLKYQVDGDSHLERENLRLCSEVEASPLRFDLR